MPIDPSELETLLAERTTTSLLLDGVAEVEVTRPQLLVESGPQEGLEFFLGDRPVVLGRGKDVDIRIEDASVSRRHAEIQPRGGGWRILDLESRSGTLLNGVPIESAALIPGTQIQLGKTELLFTTLKTRMRVEPSKKDAFHGMLGDSEEIRRVFGMIERVASLDLPVLLQGESGTGKEGLAQAVHECRKDNTEFVVVDCTLLDPEHLRSELFGHVKGAFTGADRDRVGAFERAAEGTLFLDEIGELPLDLQPMLLRALEQGEVRPLGGDRVVKVRPRVVSATNKDLREMARMGTFREDLLYRLAAIQIEVPALRERGDDVVKLARSFLPKGSKKFSEACEKSMREYPWPGNVRELRNAIQAAAALAAGDEIEPGDLPLQDAALAMVAGAGTALARAGTGDDDASLAERKGQAEAEILREVLTKFGGNRQEAAKHLGISRTTLWRRMKALGIDD
jgi:DNA-binding NtrC family response regulator